MSADTQLALAKQIREQIHHELEVLKESTEGWTKVDYPHAYRDRYHAIDIDLWCYENCCGVYKKYGRTFYFKDAKDATMFMLRWA